MRNKLLIIKEKIIDTRVYIAVLLLLFLVISGCRSSMENVPEGISVPDGFKVEKVAGSDLISYPMFANLDEEGRLFVFESTGPNTMTTEEMLENPTYRIKILEDLTGDGFYDKSVIFADSLPLPQGGHFYQGSLYVTASPDLLRLTDTTGDGIADEREVILTGWTLSVNACTLQGPYFGPDGWLYMPDCRRGYSIETKDGTLLEGSGARIWRSRPDGSGLEWISAGGFDNAVGLAFMPAGEVIGTMTYFTDPQHGQRDALMHWVEGGVYPKPHSVIEEDSLIRTGELMPVMTKLPRVSPAGIHRYRSQILGSDYKDNLFTAHFNTGKVIRSIPEGDGATFRTTDEDFLTSDLPRFHPTDVLEDADGSLLMLDTGGWFVQGCPLSGAAQEEFRGGIYRIQKIDGTKVTDPRGEDLSLETLAPEQLIQYLGDSRPVVHDRSVELLVEAGQPSVEPLSEILEHSSSTAEIRLSAVFALFRIGTPEAIDAVRMGLMDSNHQVRVAAARSAGMARDRDAADRLMEMVIDDHPAVRRQAATALGQIGDVRAAETLLSAVSNQNDRFVEHAIIHSLIILENPDPVVRGLTDESANVQKASLIALDQMTGNNLQSDQIVPFLENEVEELRRTGLWVASRHPEWIHEILDYLHNQFDREEIPEEQEDSLGDVLISFCNADEIQELMAQTLDENSSFQIRMFIMDIIGRCDAEISPELVHQVGELLEDDDIEITSRAVDLIKSRNFSELITPLEEIADDQSQPIVFRLSAIDAITAERPRLPVDYFNLLLDTLEPENEATLRQSAARIIGQSQLDDEQLLILANDYLERMEPFLLRRLLDAYGQPNQNSEVGKALIASLEESPEKLDNLSEDELKNLFSVYEDTEIQESADILIDRLRERHESRLQRLEEMESNLSGGDVGRGREIFFGNKAICSACHAVGEEGGTFGPDLTNIGEIRSRHDILEAIVYSNASFAREYETYRIVTDSGTTHTGIISEETPTVITVDIGPESSVRISRDEIVSMEQISSSMMPSGLENSLTTEELADLMAFLEALPYRLDRLIDN